MLRYLIKALLVHASITTTMILITIQTASALNLRMGTVENNGNWDIKWTFRETRLKSTFTAVGKEKRDENGNLLPVSDISVGLANFREFGAMLPNNQITGEHWRVEEADIDLDNIGPGDDADEVSFNYAIRHITMPPPHPNDPFNEGEGERLEINITGVNQVNPVKHDDISKDHGDIHDDVLDGVLTVNLFGEGGNLRVWIFAANTSHPSIPEPSSTLSLLVLGTLGASSILKRKLNSSKSTEKEITKVK